MISLKILNTYAGTSKLIENSIKNLYDGETELTILEAGCGRDWPLNLTGIKYKLIGVDLDEQAMKNRATNPKDRLDEEIISDLQYLDIGNRKVDVIFNSYVLEHIENAELVLEHFNNILKPGGKLILQIPDCNTVYGFITRISPYWFHVFYKKYMQGIKNSGRPGFGPYPTHHNKVVSRDGIREFCKSHNYIINEELAFCSYLRKNDMKTKLVKTFAIIINIISLGSLPWKHDNLTYILTKK